jgi:hypothetical protein
VEALFVRLAATLALALLLPTVGWASGNDVFFAVPGEGRITLGVFDSAGKRVRTLHALDGGEKFRVGLNGYGTAWDGLDDAGGKLPAGTYHVRGYLVGDVTVEGEAFHFNDWITDGSGPMLAGIVDFKLLPGGDVILLGKRADGGMFCARYSPEAGFLWMRDVPKVSPLLAVGDSAAVVLAEATWISLSLEGGIPTEAESPLANPRAIAASRNFVFVATGESLVRLEGPKFNDEMLVAAPGAFAVLDAAENVIAGASPDGLWVSRRGGGFERIPLPVVVESLSLGANGTVWFAGVGMDPDATPLVGEVDFSGELLRTLIQAPGEPRPVRISALPSSGVFGVLEEAGALQRLRVLSRNSEGGWTIEWERSIRQAENFGFIEGKVVAEAGAVPQKATLRFRLEENPLTGEHQEITLRAVLGEAGTQLVSEDGLPIAQISQRGDVTRAILHRGDAPDSLRVLQGDGAVVEEFVVHGLQHILPLNAGSVELR